MKARFFSVLVLWIIAALTLTACAGAANEPTQPPGQGQEQPAGTQPAGEPGAEQPPASGDKVQVKLATWAGVDEANELQAIIDELNQASTTYTIVQESSPSEYWTKIQTTIAGGTAADLMWIDQEHAPDLASRGALMDLTTRLDGDDRPAADLSDYYESSIAAFTYEGKVYGLPWIGQPVMLYVNLDYAEAAGIDEASINDWTWDDFVQACQKMTLDSAGNTADSADFDATNVSQYGFSIVPGWPPIQQFIWQAGGEVIDLDARTSPIDTPEAIEGAQFLADLGTQYKCVPAQSVISERGFGEMMKGGQVAMFMGGAADDFERTEGKRIKAFLLPQGPANRDSWAYIAGMSINAQTANPDAAFAAFMDLTQAIQEWKVPSPRVSLGNRDAIIQSAPYKEVSADNILANMEHMRAATMFPGYAEWATIFGERYVDPLVRGNGTAEELAGQVKPLLDERLAAIPE